MKVSEVFNDFYSLLTGKKFLGLNRLMEKYREEPLFWVMLSNLSETEELSLLDAMQEAYGLYKEFAEEKAGAGPAGADGKTAFTGAESPLRKEASGYGAGSCRGTEKNRDGQGK